MVEFLAAVEAGWIAESLRFGRWNYAAVNALHILGIAILVGASLPLAFRMIGYKHDIPMFLAAGFLVPFAMGGLVLAAMMGSLLFATRAVEYGSLIIFWIKLAFVALGVASAPVARIRYGWRLEAADQKVLRFHGMLSLIAWTAALVLGRAIAFVDE